MRELSQARSQLIGTPARQALTVSGQHPAPAALREEITATFGAALADPQSRRAGAPGNVAAPRPPGTPWDGTGASADRRPAASGLEQQPNGQWRERAGAGGANRGLIVLAGNGYTGAGEPVLTRYRGWNKPASHKAANRARTCRGFGSPGPKARRDRTRCARSHPRPGVKGRRTGPDHGAGQRRRARRRGHRRSGLISIHHGGDRHRTWAAR
jgi:hypothetical protein